MKLAVMVIEMIDDRYGVQSDHFHRAFYTVEDVEVFQQYLVNYLPTTASDVFIVNVPWTCPRCQRTIHGPF